MTIVALLVALAAPRYFGSLERAKETALRSNLQLMRDAIDKHFVDRNLYPESLQTLVEGKYLRQVPVDPITESNETWMPVRHPDGRTVGVYDVRSGSDGVGPSGKPYNSL